jgi:uncharacterized protein (TIGR03790 family)
MQFETQNSLGVPREVPDIMSLRRPPHQGGRMRARSATIVQAIVLLWCSAPCFNVIGGGSGLNTVVVVNQASTNSVELGNYFCERRQIPPENVLRIDWPGSNISWTSNDFQVTLVNPLISMLAARQLTNQIDYVVLSMDIPYQTVNGTLVNGTTASLFYGVKIDYGAGWAGITNSYAAGEQVFAQARPASAPGVSFLTTMITATSLAQAKLIVDHGVASDGTFPSQRVMLAKSSDPLRNRRFKFFDNAIFNARLCRDYSLVRTNCDSLWGQGNLLGLETGLAYFSIPTNTFVPGAMADSMTSFAGMILGGTDQTTLLALISAGAAGSYGTVTEPSVVTAKFPDPQNYFYQARGFSLAECYFQSLYEPYQGLVVGEPLAAPFAQTGAGAWVGLASNAVLRGTARLALNFAASDPNHPLQQVDLFVDGKYNRTISSLRPRPGNVVHLTLNGYPLDYIVPPVSSLQGIVAVLAALANDPAVSNNTQISAVPHGDRLELHSVTDVHSPVPYFVSDASATNNEPRFYRVKYLSEPVPPQLATPWRNSQGAFRLHFETPQHAACVVLASTNLSIWVPVFTNLVGGPMDFVDAAAGLFPSRYYRASYLQPPRAAPTVVSTSTNSGALLRVVGAQWPYVVQVSSDLFHWSPLFTNSSPWNAQAAVSTSTGAAPALSTFATASRSQFMDSPADGYRSFTVNGSIQVGTSLQVSVTKLNGVTVTVSATNQSPTATLTDLSQQLITQINSSPDLQGADGVIGEDASDSWFGSAQFNLRARAPGYNAAQLQVVLAGAGGSSPNPSTPVTLDQNASDLQPRDHIYLSTGVTNFALNFPLDTTALTDGFHQLTAVAYEGTSVRTQTRVNAPVQIKNSSITGNLTLLDLPDTAPVQGVYHLQVVANTNDVSAIELYSTGGLVASTTNQSAATFTVVTSQLGAGRHPFWAQVQTLSGLKYRTETYWVQLVNSQ